MKCSAYNKSVSYVESLILPSGEKFPASLGLKRMRVLLDKLDNPQNAFQSIHIAGTSGKGSTAYLIAKIIEKHGYRVGLHLSPHLQTIRERFIINSLLITEEEFVKLVSDTRPIISQVSNQFKSPVTYFEALLAMVFLFFKNRKVNFGVIETGLGGTYDGTNVLNSLITIITKIGFDHTNILGTTISEIASQKAGIVKSSNIACISQKQSKEAEKMIRDRAVKLQVPLYIQENDYFVHKKTCTSNGSTFTYQDEKHKFNNVQLSLLGEYQIENAGGVIRTVIGLGEIGFKTNQKIIRYVLSNAKFPGRFEHVKKYNYEWILDGAHNRDKMSAFINSLDNLFPKKEKIAIIGFKKDKDVYSCLRLVVGQFSTIICTQPQALTDIGMAIDPSELKKQLNELPFKGKLLIIKNIKLAIHYIKNNFPKSTLCVITGSLYLVGEARDELKLPFTLSNGFS
ncbi:MAG: Mur ligase family protein [Candidatus Daviesbacteria bacterium]|nr:Mur ligase family protein [Candidatus Daviesbacteria bacterium]